MSETKPTIFIVDDDPSVRDSLELLVTSIGFQVQSYSSAQEFLDSAPRGAPGCLVLDIRMPGLSGLDLQDRCVSSGFFLPIIFITGHGTIPMSVRAMRAGAIDFLEKPFEEEGLIAAINRAVERDRQNTRIRIEVEEIAQRLKTLSPREREVFDLLVVGMSNKRVAHCLGTSERTIKAHRGRVMEKMKANSLADLSRFAEKLNPSNKIP
jgi:two-component system response regulator FixJ